MRIFATEFTDINRSYCQTVDTALPVDLVVALREGYPKCFSHLYLLYIVYINH